MGYERIWAPWRLPYIKRQADAEPDPEPPRLEYLPGADPTCFLCQAVVDSADRNRHVIARTEHTVTVLNRYPYNNGHLLVAPRLHQGRLDELTVVGQSELAQELTRMVGLLEKALRPEGFNVGLNLGRVAGAGLPGHLHWHVVPRWNGDTNFMPALGATKVIPQSLDALWEVLVEELSRDTR
ncbi:MAG: HIT family protein [Planctomycetota bacterium]